MARKKRASLKDKGPEALGLTQKKSKGIDVLFGGPLGEAMPNTSSAMTDSEPEPEPTDEAAIAPETEIEFAEAIDASEAVRGDKSMSDEAAEKLPGSDEESPVAPPAPPIISTPGEEVDEFGLPVAMEAPPADLEFAPSFAPEQPAAESGEQDAFDPALSPFAAPLPPSMSEVDDDLSGLLEEDDLSGLVPDPGSTPPPPVATIPAEEFPMETADDLAGFPGFPPEPASPFDEPTMPPPAPDPVPSMPSNTSPPLPAPASPPLQPVPVPTTPAPPPPPILSPVRVENVGGMVTQAVGTTAEDLLPADVHYGQGVNNVIAIDEHIQVEEDALKAARVSRYVGRERRENLDMEIERLYNEVAKDLSVNKTDVEFALRTLSEAQDIIFEDTRQYDEALYRVAVVKTMLVRKRNLRRWSYTWGLTVFFYAVVWLAAFIAGFLVTDLLKIALGQSSDSLMAIRGAWFSALAGGIGGIIGIFYSLYWHVAMKQDFDRQYVMYYLVQPIMGFILGALIYFIVVAGYLIFRVSGDNVDTVTALGVVLGFVAGFRQRVVFEMIDRIVKKLLPRSQDEPDASPVTLAPTETGGTVQPPTG